jgi:hypothetical protein
MQSIAGHFALFNILNRARIKISAHMEDFVKMMDELMSWKFYTNIVVSKFCNQTCIYIIKLF